MGTLLCQKEKDVDKELILLNFVWHHFKLCLLHTQSSSSIISVLQPSEVSFHEKKKKLLPTLLVHFKRGVWESRGHKKKKSYEKKKKTNLTPKKKIKKKQGTRKKTSGRQKL